MYCVYGNDLRDEQFYPINAICVTSNFQFIAWKILVKRRKAKKKCINMQESCFFLFFQVSCNARRPKGAANPFISYALRRFCVEFYVTDEISIRNESIDQQAYPAVSLPPSNCFIFANTIEPIFASTLYIYVYNVYVRLAITERVDINARRMWSMERNLMYN